jgi:hypothetical protein
LLCILNWLVCWLMAEVMVVVVVDSELVGVLFEG